MSVGFWQFMTPFCIVSMALLYLLALSTFVQLAYGWSSIPEVLYGFDFPNSVSLDKIFDLQVGVLVVQLSSNFVRILYKVKKSHRA